MLLCQAVSSRQLPLCCVVCNGKIQRVKNNNSSQQLELAPGLARERLPSSVSGYSLAKSVSNYSIKSGSLDFDTQHGDTCEGKCHTFIRVKKNNIRSKDNIFSLAGSIATLKLKYLLYRCNYFKVFLVPFTRRIEQNNKV